MPGIFDVQFVRFALYAISAPQTAGQALGASCQNGIPVLPIDGSNPAPVFKCRRCGRTGCAWPERRKPLRVSYYVDRWVSLFFAAIIGSFVCLMLLFCQNVWSALQVAYFTVCFLRMHAVWQISVRWKYCANSQPMLCILNFTREHRWCVLVTRFSFSFLLRFLSFLLSSMVAPNAFWQGT